MKTTLHAGEEIIRNGVASLQRGAETVGGKLYLTNQRLIFEAHALNFQTSTAVIELEEIVETIPCWSKLLNLVPITPNSLAVVTAGTEKQFVLFRRSAWKAAIDEQRER